MSADAYVSHRKGLLRTALEPHKRRTATGNPKDFPMPGLDVAYWPVGEETRGPGRPSSLRRDPSLGR